MSAFKQNRNIGKSIYYAMASLASRPENPSFLYIAFFNLVLAITTNKKCRVIIASNPSDSNDRKYYSVVDKEANLNALFKHRAHGLACYAKGLKYRSAFIGHSYSLDLIDWEDNDIVVDCGANVGDLSLFFSQINQHINYIGFEPGKEDFAALEENLKARLTSYEVYNIALGEYCGEIEFFSNPDLGDSSAINMSVASKPVRVPVNRLDQVLPSSLQNYKKIKLLKLEAEGFEPEIIMGSSQILSSIEWISADLGYERGFECASTLPEVTNYLTANGFTVENIRTGSLRVLFKNTKISLSV